ncbi:MAG TPA: hypothetical protein VIY99_06420 [Terracidiphilus sp.]
MLVLSAPVLLAGAISAQSMQGANPQAAAACSLPGLAPGRRPLSDHALLSAYNAQADAVKSVQASVLVRGQSGAEYKVKPHGAQALPALLSFVAPEHLRLTGAVPFSGRRSFDLASDGRELRMLVPDGKLMRFLVGPADAPATSKNPRENLRPGPLIDALHWTRATAQQPVIEHSEAEGHQVLGIELATVQGERARVDFDLATGTVAGITMLDSKKQVVLDMHYGDWRTVLGSGDREGAVCFPRRMELTEPRQDLHVELKVATLRVNVPIPPTQFRLLPPRGIPVTRLNLPAARKDR